MQAMLLLVVLLLLGLAAADSPQPMKWPDTFSVSYIWSLPYVNKIQSQPLR